jgi:hypothetical protein
LVKKNGYEICQYTTVPLFVSLNYILVLALNNYQLLDSATISKLPSS